MKGKGPFILGRNCVALPHCTLLHRNCDVTALRCRMKVHFNLKCGEAVVTCGRKYCNRYIGTTTRLRCSMNMMNGPKMNLTFMRHRNAVTSQFLCSRARAQRNCDVVWTNLKTTSGVCFSFLWICALTGVRLNSALKHCGGAWGN